MQHGAYWIAKKSVGHGTNWLHTSVRSLRVLHDLGPPALASVNHVETFTSVCNLYMEHPIIYMERDICKRSTPFKNGALLAVLTQMASHKGLPFRGHYKDIQLFEDNLY